MRARASVVVERVGDRDRCTTLVSSPPLTLRDTPDGLFLVASGAGPVGGDDLTVDITVESSASATIRSAAASLVLPGPSGAASSMRVHARVSGDLRWLPEPTVLVRGCDHTTVARIDLVASGSVLWREEVVLGRHGEPSGSLLQRLHVDVCGRPLLRNELPVGPRWPGADGPAGLGGAGAVGALLGVGVGRPPSPCRNLERSRAAVADLSSTAWLLTVVADDAQILRRQLDDATSVISGQR
ncbi:MAG: urease accessory protein [Actinomycetota bacterium]|nr:urease accessory protein [Actinomycetota bacterium]